MAYDIYPYTNLHNLNLDWVLQELKRIAAESASTAEAQAALKEYVDNWVEEQDVPAQVREEVEREIDRLISSGELAELIGGQLPQLLANRKGRRFLFIGDSYANREGDWDDTLRSIWGLDIFDIVHPGEQTMTGDEDSYIIRDGGYGFVGVSNGGRWLDLCLQYWPSSLDKSTFTDIVIVGGYNDRAPIAGGALNSEAVYAQMQQFASGFTDSFTNAKVWLFEVGAHSMNVADMARLSNAYAAYKRAAEVSPAWTYAGGETVLHFTKSLNDDDHHHPSVQGGLDLGIYIAEALNGDTHRALAKGPYQMTPFSANVTLTDNRNAVFTSISGHMAYLCFPDGPRANFTNAVETTNQFIYIARIPNSAILAYSAYPANTRYVCDRVCCYTERSETATGSITRVSELVDFKIVLDGDVAILTAELPFGANGLPVWLRGIWLPKVLTCSVFPWANGIN